MDLILWRHAEAHDAEPGQDDLQRALTTRGEKQAARMAVWLDRQLPAGVRIFSSPAVRTEQTVRTLGRRYKVRDALSPGASVDDLLEAAGWPEAKYPVVLVGHQPALGAVAARLLQMGENECPIRKGAVWWLRSRQRNGVQQTVIVSVTVPDRL